MYWGKGKNRGHLKGALKRSASVVVDFRDQIGIYVLFDAHGDIVYIGQAGMGNARLFGRLRHHRKDHLRDRWTHFSWYGLRGFNPQNKLLNGHHKPASKIRNRLRRDALNETEAVLMSVVEPTFNKRGPNWIGTKEFAQYIDDRLPEEADEIIRQIARRLSELELRVA